jgi:hypothetical protein
MGGRVFWLFESDVSFCLGIDYLPAQRFGR